MTAPVLACSGPDALRVIQDNILYAQQHAMVVAAIAAVSITLWFIIRRWKALPIVVLVLLLIHPAWTISAIGGDCGFFKADAATVVTVVAAICLALQGLVWLKPRLRPRAPNPQSTGDNHE